MTDATSGIGVKKRGEADARADLSRRYRARLLAVARSVLHDQGESEDVAQEVLARAHDLGGLEHVTSLGAYLEASARRLAIDRLRHRQSEIRAIRRAARPDRVEESSAPVERAEERRRVVRAIRKLRDPYRSAVALRYVESLGFDEIAARLATIERTARTWVARGLAMLRECLEDRP